MHEYFKDDELAFSIYDFMILFLDTPIKNSCPQNFARLPNLDFANEKFLVDKVLTLNGWGSTLPVTREQVIAFVRDKQDMPISYDSHLRQIIRP